MCIKKITPWGIGLSRYQAERKGFRRLTQSLQCRPWLDKILELIDPKIILCVGRIAAQQLFDPNFRVTRQHGEIRQRDGRLVMATFHPAALLRNPSYKPMMEEDLRRLAEIIAEEQNAQIL